MPGSPIFVDRHDAGRRLGEALKWLAFARPVIVLGLPRGGVPVAAMVAHELDAPLDIYVVRKLGVPGHEELAFGAIAGGGARVLDRALIDALGLSAATIARVVDGEERELARREREYRGDRPLPDIRGSVAVVVDDGAATGASMRAAIMALRQLGPRTIVAALPVASRDAVALLESVADDVVCLRTPSPFYSVGEWYQDFGQTSDREVNDLLEQSRRRVAVVDEWTRGVA